MKKRLLASLLSLVMVLTMLPSAALAAEDIPDTGEPSGDTPTCTCTELCTEGGNPDCPVCAADYSACEGTAPEGMDGESAEEPTQAELLQARIDALPTAEELSAMEAEERDAVNLEAISIDDAIRELPGEEQALLETAKLDAVFEWLNAQTAPQPDNVNDPVGEEGTESKPWDISAEGDDNNVTAYLTENGDGTYALTISGTGAMADYENAQGQPWNSYAGSITEVEIDNGITHIGGNVFRNFTQLTEVNIPDGVTSLGNMVFGDCSSLTEISLPDTITTLGNNVFQRSGITEIVLPESITTIGQQVFYGCTSLTKAVFPSSLNSLGERACYGATSLEEVIFLGELGEIPDQAFQNCSGLKSISWPKNLTTIGDNAFQDSSVENIAIPEGVQIIGNSAFNSCDSLASVVLPETLTSIGDNSFRGCTSLTSIVIPEKVTSIGAQAFYNDTGLKSVVIQSDSVTVGNNAFNGTNFPIIYCKTNATIPATNVTKIIVAYTDGGVFETAPTSSDSLSYPIKDGYRFAGWYDNTEFDGEPVTQIAKTDGKNFSKYYAKWEKSSYTVPYELAFADATYGENIEAQTIAVILNSGETPGSGDCTAESSDTSVFTVSDYDSSNGTFTVTPVSGLGAGTYEETIRVTTPDGATHNVAVSLTINKVTPEIGISASNTSLTGGGTVTLTVTGLPTGAGATVTASPSVTITGSGSTFTATLPNSSQTYTFTATYTGDDNHSAATATCTVSVDRYSSDGGSSGGSSSSTRYTVSVEDTDNGSIRVSPTRAERGDTVTITIDPDTGYELDELIVTDSDGDEISVRDRGDGKYTFTMPRGRVTVEATFAEIVEEPESLPFVDVPTGAYYYDAVAWAVENGVTNGTSATTFGPDVTCTRAQMMTFLWRAAGSPEPENTVNPFTDVPASAYYYEAVLWAVEQGITNGTSATTFGPDVTVTRGQTVTFLWRYDGSPVVSSGSFADVPADAYYASAVAWAASEGVTSGTSATTFSPDNDCTRGQIVTFLYRYMG